MFWRMTRTRTPTSCSAFRPSRAPSARRRKPSSPGGSSTSRRRTMASMARPSPCERGMSIFSRFPERLQHAIANQLGFTSLRLVQELAGEAILDGKNAVVLAPTAGGKTEASMFPVLAGLMKAPPSGVGALYIAPIKALLNNQEVRLGEYTEMVGLRR